MISPIKVLRKISFLDLRQLSHNFPQFPPIDVLEGAYHRKKGELKDKAKKQNDKINSGVFGNTNFELVNIPAQFLFKEDQFHFNPAFA
jgi:hypothetical protein